MSVPTLPDKPSFTIDEVAELTGFPRRVLQDACRQERIRHQHLGRQRTFTREQVIELFANTEVEPGPHRPPPLRNPTPQQLRLQASRNRALARIERRRKTI